MSTSHFLRFVCLLLGLAPTLAQAAPARKAPPSLSPVTLLSPGAGARAVLRYKFPVTKGVVMRVASRMTMQITMNVGNNVRQSPSIPTPPMEVETTLSSKGTAANGWTRVLGVISNIKVLPSHQTPPMVIIQLRQALQKLKGMKINYYFNAQGQLKEGGFEAPKSAGPQIRQILNNLRQNMQQIIVPLPAEAIGIGASWQVKSEFHHPVNLKQTTKYTLKQNKDGRLSIDVDMLQTASQQHIKNASPYGVIHNTIHFVRTKTTGITRVRLNQLYIHTDVRGHSRMKITSTIQKQSRTLSFHMKMHNEIKAQ